jgi:hypothetical protein
LTLPGAYHSGFSTGLNIGEAVNFASKSWIKHGVQAQTIYRRSREKIPVFPYEWILIQNIIHLERVNIDMATLQKISHAFKNWLDVEKTNRKKVETLFHEMFAMLD